MVLDASLLAAKKADEIHFICEVKHWGGFAPLFQKSTVKKGNLL